MMPSLAKFHEHTRAAVARQRSRMLPRRIHVTVDVDPTYAEGMSPRQLVKLARGVTIERTDDGVTISRLPTLAGPVTFTSMTEAVQRLHDLADAQAGFAEAAGGMSTATGRYVSDRAAFLREVARVLVQRHRELWPSVQRSLAVQPLPSWLDTITRGAA